MKPTFVFALLLAVGACSEDDGANPPDLAALFPDACPEVACAAGPTVTTAPQLIAQIDGTTAWTGLGPYTAGCLPASADLTISGTVTVRGNELADPPGYATSSGIEETQFLVRGTPAGVECIEPTYWFDFTSCAGITVHDTTVRLRTVLLDIHPAAGNVLPLVEVMPACATPCAANELACDASNTCWSSVRDHCAYCLGGTNEACACWDGEQPLADGSHCDLDVSGDVTVGGTCQAGACVIP